MPNWIVVLIAVAWSTAAFAMDHPLYEPPPRWVTPIPIPEIPASADGSVVQVLLQDTQSRMGADADEFYVESAFKVLAPQGLAAAASIPLSWNPDTETLIFHRVDIIRNGKRIDMLAGGKNVAILRRESNLELSMLDGRLTASLQPEGLQVGDIVDMAVTLRRHDPVYAGRSEALGAIRHAGVAGRVHVREVWASAVPMRWRATDGFPAPVVSRGPAYTELVVDRVNEVAPKSPQNAPARFRNVAQLEISQFQTWAEVSSLMAPLYAKASALPASGELREEVEKIRTSTSDPKARTEAALRLVQEKIHYVFLGMNFGGFIPANAETTWGRRFGDCKGKTALLIALLLDLGIDAEPALVSTNLGDALADHLPMLGVFDHVFVRVKLNGKTYWLDGTRQEDRGLDEIPVPDFRWVLPVRDRGALLEKVQPQPLVEPAFEGFLKIDASAGYEAPAKVRLEHIFRGDAAVVWNHAIGNLGKLDAQRSLREYLRETLSWVEPETTSFAYDDAHHVIHLVFEGKGTVAWAENGSVWDYDIGESNLGFDMSYKREPGPGAEAPIVVGFPSFRRWTVAITLPSRGAGFRLLNAGNVDKVVAGRSYLRRSRLENGVVTMTAQEKSLAPDFPFAESQAASIELRALAALDVVVRGPKVFGQESGDDELREQPTDAAGFSRRGAAYLNRDDYGHAIEDFSAASRLEPKTGKHVYNRGIAQVGRRDDKEALKDFDTALRLNPKDVLAHLARGELLLRNSESKRGWRDLGEAVRLSPGDVPTMLRRVRASEAAGRYEDAIRDIDTLLAGQVNKSDRPDLLNARCWYRFELGRDLQSALADCNDALDLMPNSGAVIDSRGWIELRLNQNEKALADFDGALRLAPEQVSSLLGRGYAKLRMGRPKEGNIDVSAALAIQPKIEEEFERYGMKRPSS